MFDTLTREERDSLCRTLRWVLAATQTTPEGRATIEKAIRALKTEDPVGPEEAYDVH